MYMCQTLESKQVSRVKYLNSNVHFLFSMNVSLCVFQMEKQKRLERIQQKRSQLEELILQVCTNMDCVLYCMCVSAVGLVRKHVALALRNEFKWLIQVGMPILSLLEFVNTVLCICIHVLSFKPETFSILL